MLIHGQKTPARSGKTLEDKPKELNRVFFSWKFKKTLNSTFAAMIFTSSLIPSTPKVLNENIQDFIQSPVVASSEKNVRFPVNIVSITQGYNYFHQGLDLDGSTGDSIAPIMRGEVIEAGKSTIGFGNYVLVDHKNNYKSLYAHLSKILVTVGEKVTTDTKLGEMGSTGRSTGDHLHLEVYENEKSINPLKILVQPKSASLASKL